MHHGQKLGYGFGGIKKPKSRNFLFFEPNFRMTFFYLSIYVIYIASLQGNYSEARIPAQARVENKSFKELVKRARQIPWKRAAFRWETVPSRGTHTREGPGA